MDYRREIDGLRAIAVLPVILFHAGFQTFSGGFVGVDVFFVISGYLITTIILAELEQGKFSIANFYERRARRILPALFLVMLVCIPFAWFWLLPSDMEDFSDSLVAVSMFLSNILFWSESGYFDTAAELKPLLHTWSLAVEEQYYVLFPLFLMLLWRLGARWILLLLGAVFVTSLAVAQWAAYAKPIMAFYLLPTRGWELLIGAFAAFYLSKDNRIEFSKGLSETGGWVGVAFIFYAIFGYSKTTPFPGFYALVPTVGAVLVILFATQQTTVGKFVGNKGFVGVGLISYSAYLWHQPLFAFARHRSLVEPSQIELLLLSALALVLAFFSWKFIERPFRNRGRFKRRSIFFASVVCSLLFITFGKIGHDTDGYKERFDLAFFAKIPDKRIFEEQVKDCWQIVERTPSVNYSCSLGDKSGPTTFALLGDSHAGSLLYVLSEQAQKFNVQGRNYSYRSCPPFRTALPVTEGSGDKTCSALRKDFFRTLDSNPSLIPDTIIVSARWALLMNRTTFNNGEGGIESGEPWVWNLPSIDNDYSVSMRSEIVDSIEKIIEAGKIVILIYPIPEMGWDVSRVLAKHLLLEDSVSERAVSVSYSNFLDRNKSAIDALDSIKDSQRLIRVRPDKILCDTYVANRCVAHLKGEALYVDNNHLSNAGAELILQDVFKSVPRTIK